MKNLKYFFIIIIIIIISAYIFSSRINDSRNDDVNFSDRKQKNIIIDEILDDQKNEFVPKECDPDAPYWCEQNNSYECVVDGICIN